MLPGSTYRPEDILQILRKRIWLLLVPFAVVSAGVAAWAYKLPDSFRSETVILVVPQRVPESFVRSTVTTRIEDRLQSITQDILSRTRLERIIQDFNLYAAARQTGIMEDIVERMRRDISVQVLRGDSFRVGYVGDNPRTVMRVTERLTTLFIDENLRERETLAEGTNQFLESELEAARRRLVESEKRVEDYRRRFAGQLPSQTDSNLQVLQNTQMQIQQLAESMNRDSERRLEVDRQLAELQSQQTDDTAGVTPANAGAPSLKQQLEAAKSALTVLQTRFKETHPDVQKVAKAVQDLEAKVAALPPDEAAAAPAGSSIAAARKKRIGELQAALAQVDRQLKAKAEDEQRLRHQVTVYQARLEAAPTRESEMIELTRDYDTLQKQYTSLLAKKEDSKISANLERRQIGEQFKLLDPARIPERPFSPDRHMLIGMGLAAGLGIGVLLVGLLEYRDKSFKTDQEVSRLLSLPVLAVVPVMQSAGERKWALRKRLLIGVGCAATVAGCLAVVVYTFLRSA